MTGRQNAAPDIGSFRMRQRDAARIPCGTAAGRFPRVTKTGLSPPFVTRDCRRVSSVPPTGKQLPVFPALWPTRLLCLSMDIIAAPRRIAREMLRNSPAFRRVFFVRLSGRSRNRSCGGAAFTLRTGANLPPLLHAQTEYCAVISRTNAKSPPYRRGRFLRIRRRGNRSAFASDALP